jgi:NAD(P)-dependent dehydrogenase (short-subunit alcohol dehydrogenase family)
MTRLSGKRALVTGGTTGIGLAAARAFRAEGAELAITGRDPDNLARAVEELGPGVRGFRSEAGDVGAQADLAAALRDAFGTLDIVFVNAGAATFRPVEAFDEAAFDALMATNLKGPYFLLQALLPILADPASVVLNASINAHIGMPNSSVYAASKAGLLSLARTFSGEFAGRGIRVNAISPGPVATPLYGKLGLPPEQLAQTAEAIRAQIPAGRFGAPEEIAEAAVFLASDASRFMLGAEIVIDGGMSTL